jgi:hypothetical protein
VNITTENPLARPQMFRIAKPGGENDTSSEETNFVSVSINNLEFLTEIVEGMKEGSVLIFENLTGVILALGSEKKEAVYKFFSAVVEEMSAKNRVLIAFLNKSAHGNEIISAYEGLFIKIFKIEEGMLVSVKDGKIKIQIHDSSS